MINSYKTIFSSPQWSWTAFLIPSMWLCYYKMYRYFFLYHVISISSRYMLDMPIILEIAIPLIFGIYGKSLHSYWLKKKCFDESQPPTSLVASLIPFILFFIEIKHILSLYVLPPPFPMLLILSLLVFYLKFGYFPSA